MCYWILHNLRIRLLCVKNRISFTFVHSSNLNNANNKKWLKLLELHNFQFLTVQIQTQSHKQNYRTKKQAALSLPCAQVVWCVINNFLMLRLEGCKNRNFNEQVKAQVGKNSVKLTELDTS